MLKILIATSYLPWPISEGGRVAQLRVLEALKEDCEFTILYPAYIPEHEVDGDTFSKKYDAFKVLPVRCYEVKPNLDNLPLKLRLRRLIVSFLKRVFAVRKTKDPLGSVNIKAPAVPWYIFQPVHQRFVDELERHVASNNYDVVQVEFTDLMSLSALLQGRMPSIFVHHQLHFIYEQRCLESGASNSGYSQYARARMRMEEREYLKKFDRVITFSDTDERLLQEFCPEARVEASPFPSPEPPIDQFRDNAGDEKSFCILASEGNPPNVQGLDRFMREAWPLLKNHFPNLKIDIVGKWNDARKKQIHAAEELNFLGFVPDLTEYFRDKIMIVPIWIGSGIRTKILASWAAACPVITTSVGVEGLPGRPGEDYLLADNADEFVDCCHQMVENHEKRNRIAKNCWNLTKEYFSLEAVRQKRLSIYNDLIRK